MRPVGIFEGRMVGEAGFHFHSYGFNVRLQKHSPSRLEQASQLVHQLWLYDTTLVVATLKPRVGKLNADARQILGGKQVGQGDVDIAGEKVKVI